MSEEKENNYICGNCKYYDSDECYCEARGEFDLYEQDTCDSWEEDNEDKFIDENVRLKLTRGRIWSKILGRGQRKWLNKLVIK